MKCYHINTGKKKQHMRIHTRAWVDTAIKMTSQRVDDFTVQELEVWADATRSQNIVGYVIKDLASDMFVCGRHAKGKAVLDSNQPPRGYRSLRSAHKATCLFQAANPGIILNLVILGLRLIREYDPKIDTMSPVSNEDVLDTLGPIAAAFATPPTPPVRALIPPAPPTPPTPPGPIGGPPRPPQPVKGPGS